jgi:hypothetical protein
MKNLIERLRSTDRHLTQPTDKQEAADALESQAERIVELEAELARVKALRRYFGLPNVVPQPVSGAADACVAAYKAHIRAEQGEPVAYMLPRDGDECAMFREPRDFSPPYCNEGWILLYTAPQAPLTLTDAQITAIYCNVEPGTEWAIGGLKHAIPFARAVLEAAQEKP